MYAAVLIGKIMIKQSIWDSLLINPAAGDPSHKTLKKMLVNWDLHPKIGMNTLTNWNYQLIIDVFFGFATFNCSASLPALFWRYLDRITAI